MNLGCWSSSSSFTPKLFYFLFIYCRFTVTNKNEGVKMLGAYVTFTNPIRLDFFIDSEIKEEVFVEKYEVCPTIKIPVYIVGPGDDKEILERGADFFEGKILVLIAEGRERYGELIDKNGWKVSKSIELVPGKIYNEYSVYWENKIYWVDCDMAEVTFVGSN